MPREKRVLPSQLIDANDVADIIGLRHRNTVAEYQSTYPDMPRPVVNLGRGRARLWVRSDIEAWQAKRAAAMAATKAERAARRRRSA